MRVGADSAVALGWKPAWDVTMTRPEGQTDTATPVGLADADDGTLVAAFLEGHREAFDVIVERHRRHVYQLCYRFVGNHEDASDLAQDVFVRAFKGLQNFKGDSSLGTWLYRVGVNACLNRVSREEAGRPSRSTPRRASTVASTTRSTEIVRGERAQVVRDAIERLPPKQRATLVLRVYQELTHEEIAKILGSSVGAVKANFFHALGNLRRLLQTP